ncbi:MAG: hypothetical protein ACP5HU_13560 [Phycisphaerae bacterium]
MARSQVRAGRPAGGFKSRGEARIAAMLEADGVGYFYEHPLAVVADGKTRIWYPDFQLPRYGVLIEYFGRPEDPAYAGGMSKKRRIYRQNGLTAVLLTPAALEPENWQQRVLDRIDRLLADRLEDFRLSRRGG